MFLIGALVAALAFFGTPAPVLAFVPTSGVTESVTASETVAATPAAVARPRGIPRTYDDAVAHFEDAGGEIRPMKRFVLPSGNIYCRVGFGRPQGCELSAGLIKDPAVCSDNPVSKFVGRVEFIRGRAQPICNTDTIRTPGARVLPYGFAAKVRGSNITCLSETIGVTCINLAKTEGFFLHRGEYVIFNAG